MKAVRSFFSALVILVLFSATLLIPPSQPAHALDFNPGMLIGDAAFINRDSMSTADIQAFLVSKNSILATLSPDQLGAGANGRSAAQIIWDASRASISDYGSAGGRPSNPFTVSLNPQVILATLQKETSLVTGSFTVGSSTLTSMLNIAMGMGCPDSGGCDPAFQGFTNQVTYGAAQLWLGYWRATSALGSYLPGQGVSFSGNPTYAPYCTTDTIGFTISNAATSSLYRYTPHVCNGNANFWYFLNFWFGLTANPGTQPRVIHGTGPDVYLFIPSPARKYYVESFDSLHQWNYYQPIETVDDTELASIPTQGAVCRMCISDGPDVYLVTDGIRHHIKSDRIFPVYGLSWSMLRWTSTDFLYGLPEGSPIGFLARSDGSPDIYLATNERKFYIDSWSMLQNWGYNGRDDVKSLQPQYLSALPTESSVLQPIMRIMNNNEIYLVSNGQRLYVPNPDVLRNWGLDPGNASKVGIEMQALLPQGPNLTRVVHGSGPDVFYIQNGQKRYVPNFKALSKVGASSKDLIAVSDILLQNLPTGQSL